MASSAFPQQPDDLFSLSIEELMAMEISTVSRDPVSLRDTPFTLSVITSDQIRRLGARDIFDLLQLLPGLQLGINHRGRQVVGLRGVTRSTSDYLLFLLDGHPLNEPSSGSATFLFDLARMPLHNVERIEVLRGPGSAVYGANAFLGVVNIITRSVESIDGTELVLRHEFDANGDIGQEYNLSQGGRIGDDTSLTLNLNRLERDGEKIHIERDRLGEPGDADTELEQWDAQALLHSGRLRIKGRLTRQKRGDYVGSQYVPSPDSGVAFDAGFLDLRYGFDVAERTVAGIRTYLDRIQGRETLVTSPPLSDFTQRSENDLTTTKAGAEAQVTHRGLEAHSLTLGVQVEYQSQDDLRVKSNRYAGEGEPLEDVTDQAPFGRDAHRTFHALFAEDNWRIEEALTLSTGLRYDHYSDFGSSWNPRLGLKWDFADEWDLRLAYGTAFRAPDFRRLYLASAARNGNPYLHEERVRTFEAGITGTPAPRLRVGITLFRNVLQDMIAVAPDSNDFVNRGEIDARGAELEVRYDFDRRSYLEANYSYVDSRQETTPHPNVSPHSGGLLTCFGLTPNLDGGLSLYWQGDSPRGETDPRDDLDGYLLVNANLLYRGSGKRVSMEFAVFNLFDEHYAYPAPPPPNTLAEDFPAPGRSFMLGLTVGF